jgi:hypothetical protein
VASAGAWLPAIGRWLAMPATTPMRRADAIVINGGGQARTLYGVELYRQGLAPELWHTGYARSEARVTATIVERGVPRQSFRYLATTSTWSDGTQIAAAEADTTGTTTLGKRVIDHSFLLPLQVAWIVTALVGLAIVAIFH